MIEFEWGAFIYGMPTLLILVAITEVIDWWKHRPHYVVLSVTPLYSLATPVAVFRSERKARKFIRENERKGLYSPTYELWKLQPHLVGPKQLEREKVIKAKSA